MDDARQLTTVTNNLGETINYTHDLMGDVTSITRKAPDGTTTIGACVRAADVLNRRPRRT